MDAFNKANEYKLRKLKHLELYSSSSNVILSKFGMNFNYSQVLIFSMNY